MSACWRAGPAGSRRVVPLDGLCLLFHRPSATTHVVAPPVLAILDALSDVPMDEAGLLGALGLDPEEGDALAARLAELAGAGLVAAA